MPPQNSRRFKENPTDIIATMQQTITSLTYSEMALRSINMQIENELLNVEAQLNAEKAEVERLTNLLKEMTGTEPKKKQQNNLKVIENKD